MRSWRAPGRKNPRNRGLSTSRHRGHGVLTSHCWMRFLRYHVRHSGLKSQKVYSTWATTEQRTSSVIVARRGSALGLAVARRSRAQRGPALIQVRAADVAICFADHYVSLTLVQDLHQ